jgi:serine/threonine protein kinase
MQTLIDKTLGGYHLVEELGKGGMASVYKAYQPKLERWVAVKVLDPGYISDDSEILARFRREARAIAALRHPNILAVYDYGEEEGLAYIVMEYVERGTLKGRLQGEPFDWHRAVDLSIGVGRALAFAHDQGIIHRDVKPANILLPREDWPLLADFGLAKLQQARRALTQAGVILGTPDYTAPEQALGETTDHRADVYALSVVLFEMLTGQLPFRAKRAFDVLLMHINEQPPQPRDLAPAIPEALENIVLKGMSKSPDERYPSMKDMLTSLEVVRNTYRYSSHLVPPETDETMHSTTVQIDAVQSLLNGPHFVVAATGSMLHIPLKEEVLIGRTDPRSNKVPDIDLSLYGGASAGISRQHARLLRRDDNWIIEDLNSTNGTYVNDQVVSASMPVALTEGDRVRCGHLVLTFHTHEADPF